MPSTAKIAKVDNLADKLKSAKSAALLQYQGLTAPDISSLRRQIKDTGGILEVSKNSLIYRALLKLGITLPETLTGPTALTFCQTDEVAPLKILDKINKEKEKTSFKYGIYNQKLLTSDELAKFLTLPSKSSLISQLIGGLVNPLHRLAYALRFNQTQLVFTLKAIASKNNQ